MTPMRVITQPQQSRLGAARRVTIEVPVASIWSNTASAF